MNTVEPHISDDDRTAASKLEVIVQPGERFRYVRELQRSLGANHGYLVHSSLTGAVRNLSSEEFSVLNGCEKFGSLDEHAANLAQQQGANDEGKGEIRNQLSEFVDSGLLVSHTSMISHLLEGTTSGANEGIKYVCVPTRNRPIHLKRCLESFVQSAQHYGRQITFVVADQSSPEQAAANVEVMEAIKSRFGADIRHLDQNEAAETISEIGRSSGVSREILEFALADNPKFTCTAGANRNLLLLSSVDDLCLQVDDDMACRVARTPQFDSALQFAPISPSIEYWFLQEGESISDKAPGIEQDPFALIERVLGKTVSDCLRQAPEPFKTNMDQATAEFLQRAVHSDARVLVNSLGVMGESGKSFWHAFLFWTGSRRDKIIDSEQVYRNAQQNHQILTAVTQPTISDECLVRGFNMGFDNRQILPPFMPVMRGQDTLLGRTIEASTHGYFAMMPWMLEHIGAGEKDRSAPGRMVRAARLSFQEIVSSLFAFAGARIPQRGNERHQALGRMLVDLGSMPVDELNEILCLDLWPKTAKRIRAIEESLIKYNRQPKFWSDDIEAHSVASRQNLFSKNFAVGEDVVENFGSDNAAKVQQSLVRKFGELLQVWPEIRKGARQLKARRGGLGRKI